MWIDVDGQLINSDHVTNIRLTTVGSQLVFGCASPTSVDGSTNIYVPNTLSLYKSIPDEEKVRQIKKFQKMIFSYLISPDHISGIEVTFGPKFDITIKEAWRSGPDPRIAGPEETSPISFGSWSDEAERRGHPKVKAETEPPRPCGWGDGVWKTKDGRLIKINEMTDDHLANALRSAKWPRLGLAYEMLYRRFKMYGGDWERLKHVVSEFINITEEHYHKFMAMYEDISGVPEEQLAAQLSRLKAYGLESSPRAVALTEHFRKMFDDPLYADATEHVPESLEKSDVSPATDFSGAVVVSGVDRMRAARTDRVTPSVVKAAPEKRVFMPTTIDTYSKRPDFT